MKKKMKKKMTTGDAFIAADQKRRAEEGLQILRVQRTDEENKKIAEMNELREAYNAIQEVGTLIASKQTFAVGTFTSVLKQLSNAQETLRLRFVDLRGY